MFKYHFPDLCSKIQIHTEETRGRTALIPSTEKGVCSTPRSDSNSKLGRSLGISSGRSVSFGLAPGDRHHPSQSYREHATAAGDQDAAGSPLREAA